MTILEELAQYARYRVEADKKKIAPDIMKAMALEMGSPIRGGFETRRP